MGWRSCAVNRLLAGAQSLQAVTEPGGRELDNPGARKAALCFTALRDVGVRSICMLHAACACGPACAGRASERLSPALTPGLRRRTRRCLDLDNRCVRVVETVYELGQHVKGTPKSSASLRTVVLEPWQCLGLLKPAGQRRWPCCPP